MCRNIKICVQHKRRVLIQIWHADTHMCRHGFGEGWSMLRHKISSTHPAFCAHPQKVCQHRRVHVHMHSHQLCVHMQHTVLNMSCVLNTHVVC